MSTAPARRTRQALAAVLVAGGLTLAACGGGSSNPSSAGATSTTAQAAGGSATTPGGPVLPQTTNPIHNTATAKTLSITSVLVENNVDSAGKTTDDHLEIALNNTGSTALANLEVFYTYTDPTAHSTESYYLKLPPSFTIPAGATRTVHFDTTGKADHFAVNKFSLYYTSTNALDVTVEVSADGAAVQTTTVHKDAGGAEVPD